MIAGWLLVAGVAQAGPFDGVAGEDVTVERVRASDVEEVWRVGDVMARLLKSPGPDEPPRQARCTGNGVDLLVEGQPDEAEAVVLDAACARLAWDAPRLRPANARYTPRPHPWARPALRVLAAAWFVLLAACWPRRAAPWTWALVGLGARLLFPGPLVLMGVAYPYERMLTYAGLHPESLLYGAGWPAVMDLLRPLFGAHPERLHAADLLLSVAAVPTAWSAAERATGDRRVAHAAAAMAALLPLPVALARTEEYQVLCATVQVAALAGLARRDPWGRLLAACSAGLLANVRPDQAPFALVVTAALAVARSPAALVAAVPIALRARAVAGGLGQPVDLPLGEFGRVLAHPAGPGSPTVLLDPLVTPMWLVPAAVAGFVEAGRRGWPRWTLFCAVLAAWVPYLPFSRVTDQLRFQLPTTLSVALLAAMAAPAVARASRRWRAALAVVGVVGVVAASRPLRGPMVQAVEHATLREVLPTLPEGAVVRYDAAEDPHGLMARWARVLAGVAMRPLAPGEVPSPGEVLWVGRGHRAPGGGPVPDCTGDVLVERFTPPWNGGLHPLGEAPVRLALIRVVACR